MMAEDGEEDAVHTHTHTHTHKNGPPRREMSSNRMSWDDGRRGSKNSVLREDQEIGKKTKREIERKKESASTTNTVVHRISDFRPNAILSQGIRDDALNIGRNPDACCRCSPLFSQVSDYMDEDKPVQSLSRLRTWAIFPFAGSTEFLLHCADQSLSCHKALMDNCTVTHLTSSLLETGWTVLVCMQITENCVPCFFFCESRKREREREREVLDVKPVRVFV